MDENETVELEYSEDDILYYLVDEDDNEVGFVIEEDGQEVECYYADDADTNAYVVVDADADANATANVDATAGTDTETDKIPNTGPAPAANAEEEVVDLEYSEDDILYYLVDEDDNEVGFVIEEDGQEVECYYADEDAEAYEVIDKPAPMPYVPEKAADHGYLHKIASIATHKGSKVRRKADATFEKARSKAEVHTNKAKKAASEQAKKAKAKREETDLGITREDITNATSDLNTIAKEGAATAKELKETYDEIMDSFGFLVPKKIRRKLP